MKGADNLYQKTVLPNGLRILTAEMPHTRSATVSFYFGAGSRYESQEEAGLSHFVEHLLFKGSRKRPTARDISEAIDGIGGIINGATDREMTVYYTKVASPHFSLALDVLADMIRNPIFDPAEVEKERNVVLEELAAAADSPGQQAELLIDELLWPGQPLGWDVAGTPQSVSSISRDRVLTYRDSQYVANNTVVSVAGNVTHDQVVEQIAALLADWPAGQPAAWTPAASPNGFPRVGVRYKRTEQAHICLAVPGISLSHPDRYALSLLSIILGEGMSCRLFLELRERRGLVYDVTCYPLNLLDTGAFVVYAAVHPSKAIEAIQCLLQELFALHQGATEEELIKAKELAKGRLLLRLEDTRSVSGWLGGQELLLRHVNTPDDVVAQTEAITNEDITRVARDLIDPARLHLAVVGPFRSDKRFAALLNA